MNINGYIEDFDTFYRYKGYEMPEIKIKKNHEVIVSDIENRFGVKEMLTNQSKNKPFLASFLYYFGVETLAGVTAEKARRVVYKRLDQLSSNNTY